MKTTITTDYEGLPLRVVGIYTPAEKGIDYDSNMEGEPGYRAYFTIEEVYAKDSEINIVILFDEDSLIDLSEKVKELC